MDTIIHPGTPVIRSLLDNDMYKVTMGQMVFNQFPGAVVEYQFTNRGRTPFPVGLADALRRQVGMMSDLSMTPAEYRYMQSIRFMKPTYLEWFSHYRYNPDEVEIRVIPSGKQGYAFIEIRIHGPWYRTIYWEVPLMAIISELFFHNKTRSPEWDERILRKGEKMQAAGLHWIDFGTRRRAAYDVQDEAVRLLKGFPNFRGTSNVHMAHKHGCKGQGTIAHEAHMAMQVKYGIRMSNEMTLEHWVREYGGDLGIMLPDTLTTPFFMKHLSLRDAKLFDGARQDSHDLALHAQEYIDKLASYDIDPATKVLVPSDSLTDDSAIEFGRKFEGRVKGVTAGIGTFITNDCWIPPSELPEGEEPVHPLNMVIKMTGADFGYGMKPVVKFSDTPGKNTGDAETIARARLELGL